MCFMASMLDPQFVSIWVDVDVNNKERKYIILTEEV